MNRNILFVFVLMLISVKAISQSGYLGKKNYVELNAGLVPSLKFQNVIRDDKAIEKLKYGNLSYGASFTRTLTRNFEIGVGYEYARINCISKNIRFIERDTIFYSPTNYDIEVTEYNFLDDPQMTYHGGNLNFNFYRLGSLAPIGKFVGINITYGVAKLEAGEQVLYGKRGVSTKDNFFRSVSPIGILDTTYIQTERKISSIQLKGRIGRNYPLTDQIMLSVGMTFPILSKYKQNNQDYFGFNLDESYNESETSSWIKYSLSSIHAYNRISLEVSIRYHF